MLKLRTRIAAAVTAAIASLFIAVPAFAHDEVEKYNPADAFSTAGGPHDVVAILIVGVVLLAIVLLLSVWIGNLFEKKD